MKALSTSVFCKHVIQDQLDLVNISHPNFNASLALQGAQLLSFTPKGKSDFLWLSDKVEYKQGQSLRGGIPICWPWFGLVDKNPKDVQDNILHKQAHGFARSLNWKIKAIKESVHGVQLSLSLESNEQTLKQWPFEFELTAHFYFSDTLTVELETKNKTAKLMHFTQALHTYFPTDSIHHTQVVGLNNCQYTDALDQWSLKQQTGAVHFKEEVDRIYDHSQNLILHSPQQSLLLSTQNSKSSVVWNPWIRKSTTLSQFKPDDYLSMFCVESANAHHDMITLSENETHTLSMKLECL